MEYCSALPSFYLTTVLAKRWYAIYDIPLPATYPFYINRKWTKIVIINAGTGKRYTAWLVDRWSKEYTAARWCMSCLIIPKIDQKLYSLGKGLVELLVCDSAHHDLLVWCIRKYYFQLIQPKHHSNAIDRIVAYLYFLSKPVIILD